MQYPISTGQAARLLRTTEPRLSETVRRGKVRPPPPVVAGRRLWSRSHLRQAGTSLGLEALELLALIGAPEEEGVVHG